MNRDLRPTGSDPQLGGYHPDPWNPLVSSIVAAAGPELARRRAGQSVSGVLTGWARPALSAAAAVVLLVSGGLVLTQRASPEVLAAEPTLESVLVPEEFAAWLVAGYEPTVAELVVALEELDR